MKSSSQQTAEQTVPASSSGLGTFGGVFTPSILTILGVIMYLRLGWVVGNVGLLGTLIIVTLATSIPLYFAQALSVALYTIGFAESVVSSFGNLNQLYVALITTIAVAVLALTSAKLAIKAQYFIMVAIALSLVSLIIWRSQRSDSFDSYWYSSCRGHGICGLHGLAHFISQSCRCFHPH